MTENKNYTNPPQEEEELEIDLMEYAVNYGLHANCY